MSSLPRLFPANLFIRCLALLTTTLSLHATEPAEFLKTAKRIVFLGDSITNDGRFISVIETRLRQEGVNPLPEMLNLGLPSEGCTGLTEPGHPFPRPNVHERLDRVLAIAQPDVVVACYGINDGIYHPFSEERFAAFRSGVLDLVEKVHGSGATLILMTPPAFDPLPMAKKGKLAKIDAPKFAWTDIYEDYDAVMTRYAKWVMSLYEPVEMVIDWHGPVNAHLAKMRESNPDFVMSGDGVHVDLAGQTLLAELILRSWGFPDGASEVDPKLFGLVNQRQQLLHLAWLTHTGHTRPGVKPGLPLDNANETALILNLEINRAFQRREHRGSETFETIITWISANERPRRIFNGFDLSGWNGDTDYWTVANGMIRGANSDNVPSSTYLFTNDSYRNFRLMFEVKQTLSPEHSTMHSAVAAVGERITDAGDNPYGFRGPLLMFCHDWGIWDAHRRNRIEPAGHKTTLEIDAESKGDWNLVEFLVNGDRIRCAANGVEVFDFTDAPGMLQSSPIGLQLHSNKRPQEFHFRGLVLSTRPGTELVSVSAASN